MVTIIVVSIIAAIVLSVGAIELGRTIEWKMMQKEFKRWEEERIKYRLSMGTWDLDDGFEISQYAKDLCSGKEPMGDETLEELEEDLDRAMETYDSAMKERDMALQELSLIMGLDQDEE